MLNVLHAHRRERGTVLLLVPAAFLIMIVLGAIVVDVGLSQVRARELEAVASSAANDALGALDIRSLRDTGEIRFDHDRAEGIVVESIANGALPDAVLVAVGIGSDAAGRPQIAVTLRLDVAFIMAPALPGDLDSTTIMRTRTVAILGSVTPPA